MIATHRKAEALELQPVQLKSLFCTEVDRRRQILLILCASYAVALNARYLLFDVDVYSYVGLKLAMPPFWILAITSILAVAPALWMPVSLTKPSQCAYWWLYIVVVIPSMYVPFHVLGKVPPADVLVLPCVIFLMFALLGCAYLVPPCPFFGTEVTERTFYFGLGAATLLATLWIFLSGDSNLLKLSEGLHQLRMSARQSLPGGSLDAYVVATLQRCLVPAALAFGLVKKRYRLVAIGLVGAVIAFSVAGEKSIVGLPVFIVVVAMIVYRFHNNYALLLAAGALLLVSAAIAETAIFGTWKISGYGSRRMLLVPAQLTAYYWDYYSNHPQSLFSQGIVGKVLGAASTLTPSQTIGEVYFRNSQANATANIWAAGFAEAGYFGMVGATVLLGLLFRLFDGLLRGNLLVGAILLSCMALSWSECALQTSLLSHGVLGTFCLLMFKPVKCDLPEATFATRARRFAPRLHRSYDDEVQA